MKISALIVSLLLLSGLACALEEIQYQKVGLGGKIRQYAVVNLARDNGASVFDYCADCSAYITLKDYTGKIVVNNKTMTQEDTGLFVYFADSRVLFDGYNYSMKVYTISPTYGNGIVYSSVYIKGEGSETRANIQDATNNFISDLIPDDWEQWLKDFDSQFPDAQKYTKEASLNFIRMILGDNLYFFIKDTISFIGGIADKILTIIKDYFGFLLKFWNPATTSEAIDDGTEYLLYNIIYPLLMVLLPLLMIIEVFIMVQCLGYEGSGRISRFFELHWRYFNSFLTAFTGIFNIIMSVLRETVRIIIGLLQAIASALPL